MRHANVNELITAIKRIEHNDLAHALKTLGGTFKPSDDNPIAVEFYGGNGPTSALLRKAAYNITKDGKQTITITVEDTDGEFDITPEDCYPGTMSAITEAI